MAALMFQGSGSNVGKSTIVAGLCRALMRRGLNVSPFKPLNMSNNSAVTRDGGEIGRSTALQARAAGIEPTVDMNPILLKPQTGDTSQLVVLGKAQINKTQDRSLKFRLELLDMAVESFERLKSRFDIVLVEGAGSAAEINFSPPDIANMGFAEKANTPVILIGDIELGGVMASLIGIHALLEKSHQVLVKGFMINKFHGDPGLFEEGLEIISSRTGWPSFGVMPFLPQLYALPSEDGADMDDGPQAKDGDVRIIVPSLPHIANFDDLDPLKLEDGVSVEFISPGTPLPGNADLIVLPGSKATLSDLAFFRSQGWDIDLAGHVRRGGHVLGICAGYQMLGKTISDPAGIESVKGERAGLGYLDVTTTMSPEKQVSQVEAYSKMFECDIRGYEIHIGETIGPDLSSAICEAHGKSLAARSRSGQIMGVYLHGLFDDDVFRTRFLKRLSTRHKQSLEFDQKIEDTLDILADELETRLDIDALLKLSA